MDLNGLNMLNPTLSNNPIVQNATRMLQNGDSEGLRIMAQNLMKERGINESEMFQMIKNITGNKC